MAKYADIVLPLSLGTLTYSIPEHLTVSEGDGVVVSMGQHRDKFYVAVVWRVHSTPPPYRRVKAITRKIYNAKMVSNEGRQLWEWIASYYLCTLGDVMRMALPSLIKARGESEMEIDQSLFRAKKELYISLPNGDTTESLELIPARAKAKRRTLEQIKEVMNSCSTNDIPRRLIDEPLSRIKNLESLGVITLEEREVDLSSPLFGDYSLPRLSPAQQLTNSRIEELFNDKSCVLLHGVTGSGKSEIYMHQIAKSLEEGGDVLLLLPEIALTAQLTERMERVFGARVNLYHSKLSPKARTELYLRLAASRGGNLIIGVRSAILLPLKEVRLIIVDEEHDTSYKQSEQPPRYNARDCAVAYAAQRGIKTLLGSATPSLESYHNGQSGKYGYVHLAERYAESKMAQISLSDTLRAVKRGERRGHLNLELKKALTECVARGEQAILFQNRRGVAPYMECTECGHTPSCPSCNVSLTLHHDRLSCHYCGYSQPKVDSCPKCGEGRLKAMGFGTQRVEESINALLPESKVARLDADIAAAQGRMREVIASFENGDTQILIGTQMVTKGFDFGGVTLVGVLNADNLLKNPDFRAEERAYQLLTQIAGRAGRRDKASQVVIQTAQIEHRILQLVCNGSYHQMALSLLEERALFHYPPYARLIDITLRHSDQEHLQRAAYLAAQTLRNIFSRRVLGPSAPPIDKIRGEYIMKITLKIELGQSSIRARKILLEQISSLAQQAELKGVKISYDVDPI